MRSWLDSRCAARGDAVFLWFRGRTWSYADLARITDGAAAAFRRQGLKRGDRAAILLPNGPEHLFTWLAFAKLGVVSAPIHPRSSAREIRGLIEFIEPMAVVYDPTRDDWRAALPPGPVPIGDELAQILSCRDALPPEDLPGLHHPADILLTSGTTGRPKGVVQSQRTYVLTGEGFAHWMQLRDADRLFTCLPMSHINARAYSVMGALAAGASLAVEERFSASRLLGWLAECGATEVNAIGAMLHIMMRTPPSDADRQHRVRLVYSAPALGEEAHLAFERRFGVRLIVGYGLTESTFGLIHPLSGERRLQSMGRPRHHPDAGLKCEVKLVDPESAPDTPRESTEAEVGELWLRNPAVFDGYFRDEEATRQTVTADGWLRTGDLARREPGGWYTFVARAKEIIRRGGENIAPAEVESVLMSHPHVQEAAVIGAPSSLGEDDVAAFVVTRPGATLSPIELDAWCRARLATFKVPAIWRLVEELPRTPTQRVAKHLLRVD